MNSGKKIWVFPDGDLPQPGNKELFGHESLVILNMNDKDTNVEFDIYFDNSEPVKNIKSVIKAQRVHVFGLINLLGRRIIRYRLASMHWLFSVNCLSLHRWAEWMSLSQI